MLRVDVEQHISIRSINQASGPWALRGMGFSEQRPRPPTRSRSISVALTADHRGDYLYIHHPIDMDDGCFDSRPRRTGRRCLPTRTTLLLLIDKISVQKMTTVLKKEECLILHASTIFSTVVNLFFEVIDRASAVRSVLVERSVARGKAVSSDNNPHLHRVAERLSSTRKGRKMIQPHL